MSNAVANWGDERLPERFWDKVAPCPMSGCWLWTGSLNGPSPKHKNGGGYAKFTIRFPLVVYAHRHAYETLVGEIGAGLQVDHKCRVRCCVNPAHLESVTGKENTARGTAAAAARAMQAAKTHCKWGHEFSGKNVRVARGQRICRACAVASNKRRRQAKRQST